MLIEYEVHSVLSKVTLLLLSHLKKIKYKSVCECVGGFRKAVRRDGSVLCLCTK